MQIGEDIRLSITCESRCVDADMFPNPSGSIVKSLGLTATQRQHHWQEQTAHAVRTHRPQAFVSQPARRSVPLRAALRSRHTRDKRNAGEPNRNQLDIGQRHAFSTP
jgi:hypothetical protein